MIMKNKMYFNVTLTFLFACLMASTTFAQTVTATNSPTNTQEFLQIGHGGWNSFVNHKGDGNMQFRFDGTNRMDLTPTGSLGIDVVNPAAKLHVKGNIRATNWSSLDNYIEMVHGGANSYINHVGAGRMDFRMEGANKMVLTSNGRLGVGVSDPLANLHVGGGFRISQWNDPAKYMTAYHSGITKHGTGGFYLGVNDQNVITITNNGLVGVGTTNPTGLLHVNGTTNPNIKIGSGNSTLEIGSSTCTGCISNKAEVGDKVMKMIGSKNLIFDTGASLGANRSFEFVREWSSLLKIREDGKVSVGDVSTPGDYRLYVQRGILTEKVQVAGLGTADWADFVFEEDYDRNSTEEVEAFINENGHLPNVPSAVEVSKNGVNMVEMDATLLRQVEELWLHVIDLKKENEALKGEVETLKSNK